MGLFVYEYGHHTCASPGYKQLKPVGLAGKRGLLTAVIHHHLKLKGITLPTPPLSAPPAGTLSGCANPQGIPISPPPPHCHPPVCWCVDASGLIKCLGHRYTYPVHRLVVDMKPDAHGFVSLYELKKVWGVTYVHNNPWTVVMLQLEALWVDYCPPGGTSTAGDFRQCFPDPPTPRALIHEFLYLNYRVPPHSKSPGKPTWYWGPVGSVNAAALFEDALVYFVPHLRNELLSHSGTDVCLGCNSTPPPAC